MKFGYAGKPDTCLWCGQPFAPPGTEHRNRSHKHIDTGTPMFHSNDCALRFGIRAAELGFRLQRRPDPAAMFAAAHGAKLPTETPEERQRNAAQADLLRRVRNSVPGIKP
jgi:hypothetical protein